MQTVEASSNCHSAPVKRIDHANDFGVASEHRCTQCGRTVAIQEGES